LAFLSGRSLQDLEPRLGIVPDNVILAGNHGLEVRGARMDWLHPACVAARPQLAGLAAGLQESLGAIAGVELEDKGASLTLHYRRMATTDLPALRKIVDELVMPGQLRMHKGNKVFEFRPRVNWNKGLAIRRIMRRFEIPDEAVVYLGDDLTDEDVFRELESSAITIHVGPGSDHSSARLNADDPTDAVAFLKILASSIGLATPRPGCRPLHASVLDDKRGGRPSIMRTFQYPAERPQHVGDPQPLRSPGSQSD
jgi:trehalose-phosphatase